MSNQLETFEAPLPAWADVFRGDPELRCRCAVPGSELTTMCIGGPIEYLVEARSLPALQRLRRLLHEGRVPIRMIGAGSNVLISSQGVKGVCIRQSGALRYLNPHEQGLFRVGAATSLMTVSRKLSEAGFSGLEFAGGIPASLGGAVRMNAGAHGGHMADIIRSLSILHPDGRLEKIEAQSLSWSYRWCSLPTEAIVTEVEISLVPGDRTAVMERRSHFLEERKKRQPLTLPSAGSVFKNPDSQRTAGYLIEQAGLKGASIGGAKISELHGNWIVNEDRSASHHDVLDLIALAQRKVLSQSGVHLEPEIIVWDNTLEVQE